MVRRTALLAVALTLVACTDAASSDTTSVPSTSSSVPPSTETTMPPATTSSETTAVPSSTLPAVTTTTPIGAPLAMSAEGLGGAVFGADADGVVAYVRAILGAPTSDSGWDDPTSTGAPCPGTQVRFVSWNDLTLFFTDESFVTSGVRHFASFTYGPAFGPQIRPAGIVTVAGVGVGATVRELRAVYPAGLLEPGDDMFAPTFLIEQGLVAFLTDADPGGFATSFVGGFGCGE